MKSTAKKWFRETEFRAELDRLKMPTSSRTLRHYVAKGLILKPKKIPGEGNVLFYDPSAINRIKVIRELVGQGESLNSIRKILSSAKASDGEVLDFVTTSPYLELRQHAVKTLKEGKSIAAAQKSTVISAKEKVRREFDTRFGDGRYQRMIDDYLHIVMKHRHLFPNSWTKDDVLERFCLSPDKIDFSNRKAVWRFKRNFFGGIIAFLKEARANLDNDIEFYEIAVRGFEEDLDNMK